MRPERRAGARRATPSRRSSAILLSVLALCAGASAGCGKKNKTQTTGMIDARQVYAESMRQLQRDNLTEAQSLLERIAYADEDREELEPLVRLAIADATFYESRGINLIDARSLYLDFVALYGAHPLAPYAQMQAGVCSLLQVANPSRDQTLTHQAVTDLRVTEQRWPDSAFARAASTMIRQAEANLAEHEFIVGRFYLNRKARLAAVERFQRILDRYPHYREKDKVYFHLGEAQLGLGNEAEARIYLEKLVTDYPDGEFARSARRELKQLDRQAPQFDVAGGR
ncbi:MAG TPA: outer membrane protein assembly factor BamD [Candidatus Polarisedimenticolaceae bacterium]|nr:outer membrane protein assembly factor BamD [Candidatus Polarisedimenticolaceae bacterium]